ncbi:MAG: LuxR C-terminal-related transcriptional regulator [Acidimicrobiales bacterium]|jgi:DNA-binding CsgD family transcriptional regulator
MVQISPGIGRGVRRSPPQLFVGRHDELTCISVWAERARSGASGTVWIEGEAGSGKTALVRQALLSLPGRCQIVRASAHEYAGSVSLDLVHQLAPVEAPSSFAAGLELLEHLSSRMEGDLLVVVVEDLHWADADSRRALLSMAQRLDQEHLLLMITSRPDLHNEEWQRMRLDTAGCGQVDLRNFSVQEVAELADRVGMGLAPRHVSRLHQHTDGHPLYTRVLLSELSISQLEQADDLPAPRSLASTITASLARLPSEARGLASALAVLNDAVPLSTAGLVAGIENPAIALEDLLPSGLVLWHPREPQTVIQLSHPLSRAAIYDDLPPTTRRHLHMQAADVSDDATALVHRVAAAESTDDALADELVATADDHGLRLSAATRAQYLLWASSLSSDRRVREDRLIEAARVLLVNRHVSRGLALWHQVEHCGDSPRRSLVLGMMSWVRGEPADAEEHLLAASDERSVAADPAAAAQALARLASIQLVRFQAAEGIDTAERARRLQPTDDELRRATLPSLAVGRGIQEGAHRGLEVLAEEFSESAAAAGFGDADILVTRGMLGYYDSQQVTPVRDLRRATELARRGAPLAQHPRAHVHLCQLLFNSGDWDDAAVHSRLALSLILDDPHVWEEAQVFAAATLVPAARGQWSVAEGYAEQALRAAEASHNPEGDVASRLAAAWLARARGRWDDVIALLAPLAATIGHSSFVGLQRFWADVVSVVFIDALVAGGRSGEARHALDALDALHEQGGVPRGAAFFRSRAAVAVVEGRTDEATEAFDAALDRLVQDDPVVERALLRHAVGRHRYAVGDRPGALRLLREATELLEPLGADPFLDRMRLDLATWGGVRVVTDPSRTMLALTEREQSVAALVARGLTNRQAASELYVSQKAVEYHLSNIYGKLGVRSRQELRNHPALMLEPRGL